MRWGYHSCHKYPLDLQGAWCSSLVGRAGGAGRSHLVLNFSVRARASRSPAAEMSCRGWLVQFNNGQWSGLVLIFLRVRTFLSTLVWAVCYFQTWKSNISRKDWGSGKPGLVICGVDEFGHGTSGCGSHRACVCQASVQFPVHDLKGGCSIASPISLSSFLPFQKPQSSASGHVSWSGFSPRFPGGSPEGPELGYLTAPNGESRAPVSPGSQSCVAFPQSPCWCESGFNGLGSGGKTKSLSLPQLSRKLEEAFKWETHGCL